MSILPHAFSDMVSNNSACRRPSSKHRKGSTPMDKAAFHVRAHIYMQTCVRSCAFGFPGVVWGRGGRGEAEDTHQHEWILS